VPGQKTPIIQLVQQAARRGTAFARELPRLASSHPDYPAYARLRGLDQAVFLRRLIPRAVGEFEARVSRS